MGLFDTIKAKLGDSEQIKARFEELKAKDQNGELTAKGKELFEKLRGRLGK